MSEIHELEHVLSRMSGFNIDVELKKVQTETAAAGRDVERASDSLSTNDTLTGADAENDDPNVIFWNGPDDPENPLNWPQWRKNLAVMMVSIITFIT